MNHAIAFTFYMAKYITSQQIVNIGRAPSGFKLAW